MCHALATPAYISEWLHCPKPAPKKSSVARMTSRKNPRSSVWVTSSLMATPSIMSCLGALEFAYGVDDLPDLVVAQLGIHREGEDLVCGALGLRQRPRADAAAVGRLQVDRNGIV